MRRADSSKTARARARVPLPSQHKLRALAILHEVDSALDGWGCDASTECCRFAVTGREPWVTALEWRLVVDESARQGRRLPAIPKHEDERCPFLATQEGNKGGRCTVYAARPLGCRTFFCERARHTDGRTGAPSTSTRELREASRSLAALPDVDVDVTNHDDGKARPLRSWLRAALASKTRAKKPSRRP